MLSNLSLYTSAFVKQFDFIILDIYINKFLLIVRDFNKAVLVSLMSK